MKCQRYLTNWRVRCSNDALEETTSIQTVRHTREHGEMVKYTETIPVRVCQSDRDVILNEQNAGRIPYMTFIDDH